MKIIILNVLLLLLFTLECIELFSQVPDKISVHDYYCCSNMWIEGYRHIFPVDNSTSFNPRDKDYILQQEWHFTSVEEFENDWIREDGIRGNQLMYYRDSDENYYIDIDNNGLLYLKALYKDPGIVYSDWTGFRLYYNYTSAECRLKDEYKYQYGYFEARMKFPKFKGAHPAFWLFSGGHNGNALEIDIMEASSGNPLSTRKWTFVTNFSEYNHNCLNAHSMGFLYHDSTSNSLSDEFHVYAVEWTPFDILY